MDKLLPALYAVFIAAFAVGTGDLVTYYRDSFLQILSLRTISSSQSATPYSLMPVMSLLIANPSIYGIGLFVPPLFIFFKALSKEISLGSEQSFRIQLLIKLRILLRLKLATRTEQKEIAQMAASATACLVLSACLFSFKKTFAEHWRFVLPLSGVVIIFGIWRSSNIRRKTAAAVRSYLESWAEKIIHGKKSRPQRVQVAGIDKSLSQQRLAFMYLMLSVTLLTFAQKITEALDYCLPSLTDVDHIRHEALRRLTSPADPLVGCYALALLLTIFTFALLYRKVEGLEKQFLLLSLALNALLNLHTLAFYAGLQLAEFPIPRIILSGGTGLATGYQETYLLGTNADTYVILLVKGSIGEASKRSILFISRRDFEFRTAGSLDNIFQRIAAEKQ